MRWIGTGGALIAASIASQSAPARAQVVPSSLATSGQQWHQNTDVLARRIALKLDHVALAAALDTIASRAHARVVYSWSVVPVSQTVSLVADAITVEDALTLVLRRTGVKAVAGTSETIMLVKDEDPRSSSPDTGAHAEVLVRVMNDTTTQPLAGAVVGLKGTDKQEITDDRGYAALLRVPAGLRVITVRYLGYTPDERRIVAPDTGFVTVTFALKMGAAHLQEIVTTATGPRRRYELSNDITILNADSIVRNEPISNVTQILDGRVPGLTVQHTSGAPGDPSRLRLRGVSSALESNDPIVIVDNVRVYAAQSDSLSGNLAALHSAVLPGILGIPGAANTSVGSTAGAPSPLDQIDPGSIETIEVLKGPSAATLYGPDAANGVIVITTKKGHAGPARWTADASHGTSSIPGQYPVGYYRFGVGSATDDVRLCPLSDPSCTADSLVRFQALNHSQYSILRSGVTNTGNVGVSGGSEALTYAVNGSIDDEQGVVNMPPSEMALYRSMHDGDQPLGWMIHPEQLSRWSATSRLAAKLSDRADVSLSVMLTHENQQRSDLESELAPLMTTYIDRKNNLYWQANGSGLSPVSDPLADASQRVTDDATNFTNSASFSWRPLNWLTTSASVGLNVISRQDDALVPQGVQAINTNNEQTNADSGGTLTTAHGSTTQTTVNMQVEGNVPLFGGLRMQLATGANYSAAAVSTITTSAIGLLPGSNSLVGAQAIRLATQASNNQTSYGWYLAPDFMYRHFVINTGLRLDQSTLFGKNAHQPLFPKLGVSWLLSEERFFPFKKLFDAFRVRGAYGQAGVWPSPQQQLRLYQSFNPFLDGGFQSATQLTTIGNSQLRPERSEEFEGGVDADLLHDWVSVEFSGYRKMRYDAILNVPVAPSVFANQSIAENIGEIRNTGVEATLITQLLRTDPVSWNVAVNLSRNYNVVVRLGPGVLPFGTDDARVQAGYPLFSRFARPILAYTDANHDGIIEPDEVLVGDSLVYMGASDPSYTVGMHSQMSFFRGAVSVSADFEYQAGLTQLNGPLGSAGQLVFSPGSSDPHAPFSEQAAAAVLNETDYGAIQRVSTFRFQSLSVAYHLPRTVARWLMRAADVSVALQGTNLGLFTNYKGKDPDVNTYSTGNQLINGGVVPQPRVWIVRVNAAY